MPCARWQQAQGEKLRLRNKNIIPNRFAKWLCQARSATLSRVDAFRDLAAGLVMLSSEVDARSPMVEAAQVSERTKNPGREPMNGNNLRSNATRRSLLKTGVGPLAGTAITAPYIRDAQAA